jgi:hypothetical protein
LTRVRTFARQELSAVFFRWSPHRSSFPGSAGRPRVPLPRARLGSRLTQACDLANEKTVRATVAVVHDAASLVKTGRVKDRFIRDQVRKGQVYG